MAAYQMTPLLTSPTFMENAGTLRERLNPVLYYGSADHVLRSFDCNCGGGLPEFSTNIPPSTVSAILQVHPELRSAALPGMKQVVFSPASPSGALVLNEAAQRILTAFTTPLSAAQAASALADLPADVVLRTAEILTRCGVLRECRA